MDDEFDIRFVPNSDLVIIRRSDGTEVEVRRESLEYDDISHLRLSSIRSTLVDIVSYVTELDRSYICLSTLVRSEEKYVTGDYEQAQMFTIHNDGISALYFGISDDDTLHYTLYVSHSYIQDAAEARKKVIRYVEASNSELISLVYWDDPESPSMWEVTMRPPLDVPVSWCYRQWKVMDLMLRHRDIVPDTPDGAYALLLAGYAHVLLGQSESVWLDAKRSQYGIEANSQKYELACDVASFANAERGGIIVIGFATEQDAFGRDILTRITPLKSGSFNIQTYMQAIKERIVPPINGLSIDVVKGDDGELAVIFVPVQDEEVKPILVKGALIDGRVSGAFFSIPRRRGSDKWNMSPESVHSMLVAARIALRSSVGTQNESQT